MPGFNISDFRSQLKTGGERQNLFQVSLPFLQTIGGDPAGFTFMCKAASLPGEDVAPIVVPYFGRQIKVPGDRTFTEWSVTVINDEDFTHRNTFIRWSNYLNGHVSNLRLATFIETSKYSGDASIIQYSKTGAALQTYKMIGCWPSTVTPIDMAWDANDQIEDFQVTLQYQYWESLNGQTR